MEKINSRIIVIVIVVAAAFGFASGIVGEITARVFLLENTFNVPFFGEINVLNGNYDGSNLIIRSAKKVVVEQNAKILESVNSLNNSFVGLFRKQEEPVIGDLADAKVKYDLSSFYKKDDILGQGFIITSDGWIVSSYVPQEFRYDIERIGKVSEKRREQILKEHVVITFDQIIYEIDAVVVDKIYNYSFWHINANDLPVKRFVDSEEINNGQLVMAVNWNGWVWLSTILGQIADNQDQVRFSDNYFKFLELDQMPRKEFYGSFLFSLSGDMLGFIDREGKVGSITNYISCINCLLKDKDVKHASLGVYYIDLSQYAGKTDDLPENGALIALNSKQLAIVKGSPADLAELRAGDIILSINNIQINKKNGLGEIIGRMIPGDMIDVKYLRDKKEVNISLKLGEL